MSDLLPNSKPREKRIDWSISTPGNEWVYIFCANCGRDGGRVLENEMDFAFYLCDPCAEKYGEIAGVMLVPDQVFWAEIAAERKEKEQKVCLDTHLL